MRPKLPTFRSSLIRLHKAILRIDEYRWWIDRSPPLSNIEIMVLLLEDRRFFEHIGFDWRSILREAAQAVRGRRHGGASTIDMQLFRTASNRYERTIRRKVREILGVLVMQRKFSKIEILRTYLRVAYFGTGLKGVNDAVAAMFPELGYLPWEEPTELSLEQAAIIASLLVYPKPRVVNANWSTKIRRRADYGIMLYRREKERFNKVFI